LPYIRGDTRLRRIPRSQFGNIFSALANASVERLDVPNQPFETRCELTIVAPTMAGKIQTKVGAKAPDKLDPQQSANCLSETLVRIITGNLCNLFAIEEKELGNAGRN
jgi:hypothetical protein